MKNAGAAETGPSDLSGARARRTARMYPCREGSPDRARSPTIWTDALAEVVSMSEPGDLTELLLAARAGECAALDRLFENFYAAAMADRR